MLHEYNCIIQLNEIFVILTSLNFKNLKKLQFHILSEIFRILTSLNFKNLKKLQFYILSKIS